ncbi:MAG: hypothetical protein ACI8T1_003560 [Verrucomicrobiales bacterium]|jgi:hypothetical protein
MRQFSPFATAMLCLILPLNLHADLVISEVQAANSRTLVDLDGDSSDWVEIYNSGPSEVNLDGYHLTDDAADLVKWKFPAVSLTPGGFLVVFASGKDRDQVDG